MTNEATRGNPANLLAMLTQLVEQAIESQATLSAIQTIVDFDDIEQRIERRTNAILNGDTGDGDAGKGDDDAGGAGDMPSSLETSPANGATPQPLPLAHNAA